MQGLADVVAVILAGGLGTRLRPALADRPKALADIRGRPFVTYLLDQLAVAGARQVVLSTGYLGDQVRAALGDSYGALNLLYSQESSPLDTGGALSLALPVIDSDCVLVMNGDSFCNADLRDFHCRHLAWGAGATLVATKVPDVQRYGRVNIDADGVVVDFAEKDTVAGAGWINAGVYLMARRLLAAIPSDRAVSLERELFPALVGRGLYGYKTEGRFLDIGTPASLAAADEFFAQEVSA